MRRSAYGRIYGMELRRTLRDPLTWAGLFAFVIILLVGAWLYWRTLPPRPQNSRLFGEAFMLATIIAWHTGIARDRATRFDVYLAANLVEPSALYAAKVTAALTFLLMFGTLSFVVALAASAGDFGYAAHYTGLLLLASMLALPALVVIELALTTRYPMPILLLLLLAGLGVYSRMGDVQALMRWLGMSGEIRVVPATLRTATALLLTALCYPLYRLRLGRRRLATEGGAL